MTTVDAVRQSFGNMVGRLNMVVGIFIAAAGLLAFVILYNLTNLSVQERMREIATVKTVGFTDGELTAYVYLENVFHTLAGILLGLAGGVALHRIVIRLAEVNVIMFSRQIYERSFFFAVAITAGFALIASVLIHRRLQRINVVTALKTVE